MSEGQRFQLGTVGALGLSVVSSVSIVICNKALISTLGSIFGEIIDFILMLVNNDIVFVIYFFSPDFFSCY